MFEEALLEKVDICNEILKDCRNELYLNLRFLDVALHSLVLAHSSSAYKRELIQRIYL